MDRLTKANCIALVLLIVAIIVVAIIICCTRGWGGNGDCGWSGSSGGDCPDTDDDCDEPVACRPPPKNSCGWGTWIAVILGVILLILLFVVVWRCFFSQKKTEEITETTLYAVAEEPCDKQRTNVTFIHDPKPDVSAVSGVCADDTGECTFVTVSSNGVPQIRTARSTLEPSARTTAANTTQLQKLFAGQ